VELLEGNSAEDQDVVVIVVGSQVTDTDRGRLHHQEEEAQAMISTGSIIWS